MNITERQYKDCVTLIINILTMRGVKFPASGVSATKKALDSICKLLDIKVVVDKKTIQDKDKNVMNSDKIQ